MITNNITRRQALVGAGVAAIIPNIFGITAAWGARPDGKEFTPAEVVKILRAGNSRWAKRKPRRRSYAPKGQGAVAGQWPIAAVLGCADSRVQPDEIFDLKPSNLFVVRNAGNVVDDDVLGSLEYAVEHLGVNTIVVMGHSLCGAVKASEATLASGVMPGAHVTKIVERILPALKGLAAGHTLADAVSANTVQSAQALLSESDILREAIEKQELLIVHGVYELATRRVTLD
jgi:carbonic anhydrase